MFCLFSCHSVIAFVLFPDFLVSVFQVCMLQKSTEIEGKTCRTMYPFRQLVFCGGVSLGLYGPKSYYVSCGFLWFYKDVFGFIWYVLGVAWSCLGWYGLIRISSWYRFALVSFGFHDAWFGLVLWICDVVVRLGEYVYVDWLGFLFCCGGICFGLVWFD